MVFGSGPFRMFEYIREFTSDINEHFGTMFSCMMCFPANCGWVLSLIDWFFIKDFSFTPLNMALKGTNLWWLAILGDICFASGVVWLIHTLQSFFESLKNDDSEEI